MTPQKKVTQILYSGLGGHGSVAFSLAEADVDNHWQKQMLFYGIEPLMPAYREKCERLNIPFAAVHKQGKNFLNHWLQVLQQLREFKPDVVILHSLTLILPVAWYCRKNNCRLIAVEHTPNQVKPPREQKASALAMKYADQVVLLTEAYREELKEMLGNRFAAHKVSVIPNGIDTDKWSPATATSARQDFYIGMAARFSHSKDFDGLIRAFAALLQLQGLPVTLQLLLAGDGATKAAATALVQALGIADKVHFAGNLNENELMSFMQSLDLYVHASKGETMSTSIMQALSCGLPVLASDIPGINNLIDGKNGLLFDTDEMGLFVSKMNNLIQSPDLCEELGKNARSFAMENLSARVMLERYKFIVSK